MYIKCIFFFIVNLFCLQSFAAENAGDFPTCSELLSAKIVRDSFGSTTPVWQIAIDGKSFIVKFGGKPGHSQVEAAAFNFLRSLGLPVPRVRYYDETCFINQNKGPFLLSEFIEGKLLWETLEKLESDPQSYEAFSRYFVILAWAGVTGAFGKCANNVIVTASGQFYFIDLGTVFGRTASGKINEEWFSSEMVQELKTFRNRVDNLLAADCFKNLSLTQIIKQIEELESSISEHREYELLADIDIDKKIRAQLSRRLLYLKQFAQDESAQKSYEEEVNFWARVRDSRRDQNFALVYDCNEAALAADDPYLIALRKGLCDPTSFVEFRPGYRHRELVLCNIPFQEGRRTSDGKILPCDIEIYALQSGFNMPTLKSESNFICQTPSRGIGIIAVEDDGRIWSIKNDEQFELPHAIIEPNRSLDLWSALFHGRQTGLEITPTDFMPPVDLSDDQQTFRFYIGKRVGGDPGDIKDISKCMVLLPPEAAVPLLKGLHRAVLEYYVNLAK